jgi:hypothetical protein
MTMGRRSSAAGAGPIAAGGKRLRILLALACWIAVTAAQAAEVMLCRVTAVDRTGGILTVQTLTVDDHGVRHASEPALTVMLPPGELPSGLQPGHLLRLWTSGARDGQGRLLGLRVAEPGPLGRPADATGVRSRLGRDAGSQSRAEGQGAGSGGASGGGRAGGGSGSGAGGGAGGGGGGGGGGGRR